MVADRVGKAAQHGMSRLGLAGHPIPDAGHLALALVVFRRGAEMRRLGGGKGVELEREPGVAGRDQPMADELVAGAKMATEAKLRPRPRLCGRVHAGRHVLLVVEQAGDVRAQPLRGAAMAGLAVDPVVDAVFRATAVRRHEIGVTAEAKSGVLRRPNPEIPGDAPGAIAGERGKGLGVVILLRPDLILGLQDRGGIARVVATVADDPAASRGADMNTGGLRGRSRLGIRALA